MPKPRSLQSRFEKDVADAKATGKKQRLFDPGAVGLLCVITAKGKKTWCVVARDPQKKLVWKTIGDPAVMSLTKARELAAEAVARVKEGKPPIEAPDAPPAASETFTDVAKRFIERHVEKQKLRSAYEIKRQFDRYIYPDWGSEAFASIRRGKVIELLDTIEDNSGPVMADRVLATLRKLFNWIEVRDEEYTSPIVRGMRVSSAKERARKRILTDDEIRLLWPACDQVGTFGAFVKVALLSAQRKSKVATMRWDDLKDGVWTIPAEAREKVNAGELKLPKLALAIIDAQPSIKDNPFVFAGRGTKAFNSFSDGKEDLHAKAPIAHWTIHDLRRTARSLMARAGVRSDIAERTLGHVITGVEGVYDRHTYSDQKGEALEALANLVERILQGDASNVVQMASAR